MYITEQELRNKILGCWFGKNVGGTLGAPYEWRRQINNVTFYQDSVNGEPLPNDDLDIQLLWLIASSRGSACPPRRWRTTGRYSSRRTGRNTASPRRI